MMGSLEHNIENVLKDIGSSVCGLECSILRHRPMTVCYIQGYQLYWVKHGRFLEQLRNS
jgi:hypothetical protein